MSTVRTELQTAVFDLDHNRKVADALARARTAYVSAPGDLLGGRSVLWAPIAQKALATG
jgi:hypothetical protein